MRASLALAWVLFLVYSVWSLALQGLLASADALGEWTPDLGLVLLFAWVERMPALRGPPAALLVALAWTSFAAAPPLLLAAALLGALGLYAGLRTILRIDRAVPRAFLAGLSAWLTAQLLLAGRTAVLAAESSVAVFDDVRLWPGAVATGLACLLLAPLSVRLPGLAPLARRRP